jgi:methyltransferase (TIGR00027 family)
VQKSADAPNSDGVNGREKGPSKMAERIALIRARESRKPEDERVCYDPYAIHFISQEIIDAASRNPDAIKARWEQFDRLMPGLGNSIVARVRYFDDFVKASIEGGLEQLVILGAGYDSRAYRIEGLKGRVRVFEVDHPTTQAVKIEKIREIFGRLPDHVSYVSVDFEKEEFGKKLIEMGYNKAQKTLFIMEGLVMYIPPKAVDDMLSFIVKNSGKGSEVLFDYLPEFAADGSSDVETGKNILSYVERIGEPSQFGIKDGAIELFLAERGFSQIQNVTSEDYKREYFRGINGNRIVYSKLSFAHAVVE